jgi:hypothetical protein
MTGYFVVRGKPEDAWPSFQGGYMGIPERGYYLREDAAQRKAEAIAEARGAPCFVKAMELR